MNRTPVKSSNVASIGWENNMLEVEFQSGDVYQYFRVPEEVYNELFKQQSIGKYLRSNIYGRYGHKKL